MKKPRAKVDTNDFREGFYSAKGALIGSLEGWLLACGVDIDSQPYKKILDILRSAELKEREKPAQEH